MTPRSRRGDDGPRPLHSSLDALTDHLGMGATRSLGRLFSQWEEIVGPAVADHVRPVRVDGDTLVVTVDHPAWATQVRHLGDEMLERVGEITGPPRPTRLEVRVRR